MNITEFTLFLFFCLDECLCKGVDTEFFFAVKTSVIFYKKCFFCIGIAVVGADSTYKKINGNIEIISEGNERCNVGLYTVVFIFIYGLLACSDGVCKGLLTYAKAVAKLF